MIALQKVAVLPLLHEFRKLVAEMRADGAAEQELQSILAHAVVEICNQVDDEDGREWLVRQFREAVMPPRIVHEGTGTLN